MKTIFILEDHPIMQKGLVKYFENTNRWKVLGSAASLASAKEKLIDIDKNGNDSDGIIIDVILLDIQLDNKLEAAVANVADTDIADTDAADASAGWGLDLISWIKEQKTACKKSVLPLFAVYSAFDDYAHVSIAVKMGVKAYITKRRSEQELETALFSALNGEVYIDEAAKINLQKVLSISSLLTKRETEILNLVKSGFSNKQIAAKLNISYRTVENILSCLYDKTGIKTRLELQRL